MNEINRCKKIKKICTTSTKKFHNMKWLSKEGDDKNLKQKFFYLWLELTIVAGGFSEALIE